MNDVETFLQTHGIDYVLHEHPAVFTCEEAEKHCGDIPGLACKNLFLKDKKEERYFLVVLPAAKRADLKQIGEAVGGRKLRFASPESLQEKLGLDPGSVSPFGLLNDTRHEVELCADREVLDADTVTFHPNRNTATIELSGAAFQQFLQLIEHEAHVL